jgi:hypothetical protein
VVGVAEVAVAPEVLVVATVDVVLDGPVSGSSAHNQSNRKTIAPTRMIPRIMMARSR